MRKLLLLLLVGAAADAQKATEVYIPIGKSPGLSGKATVIGMCTGVAGDGPAVTVRAREKTWIGDVTPETEIYLDRSRQRLPNRRGTAKDLRAGCLMEIKYKDTVPREGRGACEWIKVRPRG
jgi:hypothetical protein